MSQEATPGKVGGQPPALLGRIEGLQREFAAGMAPEAGMLIEAARLSALGVPLLEALERAKLGGTPFQTTIMSAKADIKNKGWIGVDLDGTLAFYDRWRGIDHIGPPIEPMKKRVLWWLAQGREVRIFTARVGPQRMDVPHTIDEIRGHIEHWCLEHLGGVLPVTATKDYDMEMLWDDRAREVVPNTGMTREELEGAFVE